MQWEMEWPSHLHTSQHNLALKMLTVLQHGYTTKHLYQKNLRIIIPVPSHQFFTLFGYLCFLVQYIMKWHLNDLVRVFLLLMISNFYHNDYSLGFPYVDWIKSLFSQDVNVLIPGTCDYHLTRHKRMYRCDYIKDIEVWDHPRLSGWVQCNHKGPNWGKQEDLSAVGVMTETRLEQCKAKLWGRWLLEAEREKEMLSPSEAPEEDSPANMFTLA